MRQLILPSLRQTVTCQTRTIVYVEVEVARVELAQKSRDPRLTATRKGTLSSCARWLRHVCHSLHQPDIPVSSVRTQTAFNGTTMELLRLVQKAYTLDTLDTRFIPSAPATADKTAAVQSTSSRRIKEVSPSKWNTPEFYVYYLVFLTAIPAMFYTAMSVSLRMFGP